MFEQKERKLLDDATSRFPEECLCEDCGECAFCCFILNHLPDRRMNSFVGIKKSQRELLREKVHFDIPMGEAEQIDELRRIFQSRGKAER